MAGRFIGKTVVEHRREFIENSKNCKQIDDFLDIKNSQKRHRAPKPIFLGLESEKIENQIPNFDFFENYMKFAHEISLQNGSYAFPNELTRFQNKAKAIWVEIRKHCKNAVII